MKKQVFNPYLPSYEYVPDGEPYVFGDRLYVYGSHDEFNGKNFCLGDYVCWSAPVNNLGNWKYEGVIYRRTQDPKNKNGTSVLNAPDVQKGPDGRYYLYYVASMLTIVSVAVSDKPEGPLFSVGSEFEGHAFYEASSMRRIHEKYYFVYSSELSHELCYAVGENPLGPFQYGGTLISIGDIGFQGNQTAMNYLGNTHGGMVELNGEWYIFYHRQTNKQKCCRQGCAEKLTILEDGSILQAELTSCGLNGGPLCGKGLYEARIACHLMSREGSFMYEKSYEKDKAGIHPYFTQTGEDREKDGDQYIANMTDGSVAGFKYFQFEDETLLRVMTKGTGRGKLEVRNSINGEKTGEIEIEASREWEWSESVKLKINKGTNALYFKFNGEGSMDFYQFELL